jgi:hypothetical protein
VQAWTLLKPPSKWGGWRLSGVQAGWQGQQAVIPSVLYRPVVRCVQAAEGTSGACGCTPHMSPAVRRQGVGGCAALAVAGCASCVFFWRGECGNDVCGEGRVDEAPHPHPGAVGRLAHAGEVMGDGVSVQPGVGAGRKGPLLGSQQWSLTATRRQWQRLCGALRVCVGCVSSVSRRSADGWWLW